MKETGQTNRKSDQHSAAPNESYGSAMQKIINHANVSIKNLSAIATSRIVQLTDCTWDAVVTSRENGTFLIRRRKIQPAKECQFLSCEILRIDTGCQPGQADGREYIHESGSIMACNQEVESAKILLPEKQTRTKA